MENIAIIGHGGHANALRDTVESLKTYRFRGFIGKTKAAGVEYNDKELKKLKKDKIFSLINGVGNISYPWVKEMIERYLKECFEFPAIIHPSAVVSKKSRVGCGTVVLENAVVKAGSIIGDFCIVNSLAVVSHDCKIGDYAHISLGAKVGGDCRIGENSFLGINSSVIQNKKIGDNVIIGAGTVVVDDIRDNVIFVGNPAKIIKERQL